MNNTKDISLIASICIVIPTYNRAAILAKSLQKYLAVQHIAKATMLIIDNNSSDNTAQVVRDFTASSNLKVQYFFEKEQGLSYAKNRAIEICEQSYMLFLDDDCYPQPDILEACATHVESSRTAVVGKIKRWAEMVPAWNLDAFFIDNHPSEVLVQLDSARYFKGGIVLLSRNVIENMGAFNTSLGMNGTETAYGEDTDLALRLLASKQKIFYDPSIVMYHCSHQNSVRGYLNAYYTLNKNAVEKTQSVFNSFLKLIKSIILSPISFLKTFVKYKNIKTAFANSLIPVSVSLGRFMASWHR